MKYTVCGSLRYIVVYVPSHIVPHLHLPPPTFTRHLHTLSRTFTCLHLPPPTFTRHLHTPSHTLTYLYLLAPTSARHTHEHLYIPLHTFFTSPATSTQLNTPAHTCTPYPPPPPTSTCTLHVHRYGTTVEAACKQVHRTLVMSFDYAMVWGLVGIPQCFGMCR